MGSGLTATGAGAHAVRLARSHVPVWLGGPHAISQRWAGTVHPGRPNS
jgi:hypothetical protein